jgi:ABC-type transport system substrate-binding protein
VLRKLATSCLIAALLTPADARTRPHYGETLRIEIAGDTWERPNGLARRLVFDGLTNLDTDGNVVPGLATSWTSENSAHRWQFRLRPGVRFHDGALVTPAAIAASLMNGCSANCPWGAVRALSSSLIFTSDSPMPQLPDLLAGDDFLISKKQASDSDGGSGSFQVVSDANGVLSLAANEASWQGRPFADAIELRPHRSTADQWLDLNTGRADIVEVPVEEIRQAQQQHLTLAVSAPVEVLALQIADSGALANANLRAAIALAIDRNALANVVFQKQAKPAASLLPQAVSGFAFLFSANRDLNKAHELRGGNTPPVLSLAANGFAADQLAAQRIVLNLREAGFNVQLVPASTPSAEIVLRRFRVESADPSADLIEMVRASGNVAPAIPSDPAAAYLAEREFLDRRTLIPLVHIPRAYAFGGRVHNLQLGFDGRPELSAVSLEAVK